jgi:CheY-like chemotaxis protein
MNAILGFAQIIEISDPTPQQRQWAGEIRRAGAHLLQMIEELLDLSRIEVGKMAIRLEPLDPRAIVAEAVAIVQPLLASRGLRLVQDDSGPAPLVLADRLRLRQVLVNLLSNAAKYNRERGEIRLACTRRGESLRLSVADHGVGLAPEQLARLFRPFERLGAELGDIEGTGIGLALSKQLAELMGAALGADSQVGVGSVFWIDLRLAGTADTPPAPDSAALAAAAELACDIVYIEDKASNIELLSSFLSPFPGIRLRCALSGDVGLTMVRERRPDIVLLDIHLPGMDGYAVLRALRALPEGPSIGVIAVSADAMPHDVARGLAAGFDRYVVKPVNLRLLVAAITDVLQARRAGPPPR